MEARWRLLTDNIYCHVEDNSWKIVKTLELGYVIDHVSIPYPRLEYVLLENAMESGDILFARWQLSQQSTLQ